MPAQEWIDDMSFATGNTKAVLIVYDCGKPGRTMIAT
jgi:hypothetical protein